MDLDILLRTSDEAEFVLLYSIAYTGLWAIQGPGDWGANPIVAPERCHLTATAERDTDSDFYSFLKPKVSTRQRGPSPRRGGLL